MKLRMTILATVVALILGACGGGDGGTATTAGAEPTTPPFRELAPKPDGLTAAEIVALALENSPALAKATLEYDKAAANRARAKLAFAPRIDLAAGYTRLSDLNLPILGLPGPPPMQGTDMGGLDAEPEGFRFPVILNQYTPSARP